jgi:hypothetical protein
VALSWACCCRLINQLIYLCQHHSCNIASHNTWVFPKQLTAIQMVKKVSSCETDWVQSWSSSVRIHPSLPILNLLILLLLICSSLLYTFV